NRRTLPFLSLILYSALSRYHLLPSALIKSFLSVSLPSRCILRYRSPIATMTARALTLLLPRPAAHPATCLRSCRPLRRPGHRLGAGGEWCAPSLAWQSRACARWSPASPSCRRASRQCVLAAARADRATD